MAAVFVIMALALVFYAGLVLYCWRGWSRRKRERAEHDDILRRLRS